MNRQAFTDWLKHRPWLILPMLGLVPLVGIPLIYRSTSVSQQRANSSSPVMPATTITLPAIAESPLPTSKFHQSPTPQKVSTVAATVAKPSVPTRSARVEVIQPAFNLSVDAVIQMRVLLHKAVSSLSIGASAGGEVIDVQSGKRLHRLPSKASYEMLTDGESILIGSTRLPTQILIEPAADGVTFIGDRAYRGRLLIASSQNRLWVVNYVNLQQYLHSVVGSEVSPSWPMEALKAQAVAARSYALTYHLKPVKRELYDLGSDEYYQVYKGVESEATTTRQAVNKTSGEFVSYRGGVVESLYAATDDIVMDAFQGRGMSQIGALGLAEQGQTYRQILSAYYAGTGIGRIEMDVE